MSRDRDIKNAQAALNEAVGEFVGEIRGSHWAGMGRFALLVERWDALEQARNDFDGAGPAVGRRTSVNAAKANIPLKGSLRRRIVEAVAVRQREFGVGMTCDQLEVATGARHQSVSPAVSEMERGGWIKDSGEERLTRSNQPAIVWEPTDKLIDRLREIELGADRTVSGTNWTSGGPS